MKIRARARRGEKKEKVEKKKNTKRFGSTVGKGYYHHAGGPKSMSSGGRRHNGSHNGHHGSGAGMTAVEHNGHHPPREPRKEESTLVRRSFRRCGDEWRADSRRCVSREDDRVRRFLFSFTFSPILREIKRVIGSANENGKCLFDAVSSRRSPIAEVRRCETAILFSVCRNMDRMSLFVKDTRK